MLMHVPFAAHHDPRSHTTSPRMETWINFFLKILFIYLTHTHRERERERERSQVGREAGREREEGKQAPC